MCCKSHQIFDQRTSPNSNYQHKNHQFFGSVENFFRFSVKNSCWKAKKLAVFFFKFSTLSFTTFLFLFTLLFLTGHDLTKCPVNAVDSLTDISRVDPVSNDLAALLNITDNKSNRTAAEHEPTLSPPFVQLLDGESAKGGLPTQSKNEPRTEETGLSDGAEKEDRKKAPVERPPSPPPIATFEEWTKEKLMSKEKKSTVQATPQHAANNANSVSTEQQPPQNPKPTDVVASAQNGDNTSSPPSSTPQPSTSLQDAGVPPILNDPAKTIEIPAPEVAKRNYASKECGAKVLLANDEAEHRNAVLNDKERDEYMRNPCEKAQNKFLIIELCETIQPNLLELANFELFSSSPRDIRLSISERYPTAEWTPIGQVVAQDTREMQTFQFASHGIYAKFIRLELLSHYGKEHYCTLSTVRVSGISMVDEYEAEASNSMDPVAAATVVTQPIEQLQPIEIASQAVETTELSVESEQKLDPSNESAEQQQQEAERKAFVLNKVVDIVGNLGQIKEVIGKTLLGGRDGQTPNGRILPNSCSHHCPIDLDLNHQCPLKCHLFGLFDLSKNKPKTSSLRTHVNESECRQTAAQKSLLRSILKLSQCPTAISSPKTPRHEPKTDDSADKSLPLEENTTEKALDSDQKVENQSPPNTQDHPAQQQQSAPAQVVQQQPLQVPKAPPITSLPGTTSTHKESVFMKLNKRLAALELNMSLSSEYLSELSRRYVAQQDGYNKQHERDLKTLEEMVSRLGDHLKAAWSEEVNRLRSEIDMLSREMRLIKRNSRHIPAPFDTTSSSSLEVHGRYDGHYERNCYNIIPPRQHLELTETIPTASHGTNQWTTEQILAVVTLSNLSAFTLVACVFLLYKILTKRKNSLPTMMMMNPDELRALIQKEVDRLTQLDREEAGEVEDLHGSLLANNLACQDSPHKRPKRKHRHPQQMVVPATLSIPSTSNTTSTSALDTMSSSASISDVEQTDHKDSRLLVKLIGDARNDQCLGISRERSTQANAKLMNGIANGRQPSDIIATTLQQQQKQQLSPPWQTVPSRRKFSDRSPVKNPNNRMKVKIN